MERYTLILKHEVSEDGETFFEVEDTYEASVKIGNLYEGIKYYKETAIKDLCDSMIKFIKEEKGTK